MNYFVFPWEQIGYLLRKMSLDGAAGNVASWILFIVIGGCPLFLWGLRAWRKKSCRADLLLPLLSLVMFGGLWFMINPFYLEAYLFPAGAGDLGKCALGLTIDSILLCWVLLRVLENCGKMGRKSLLKSLEILLGLYAALSAAAVLLQGSAELLTNWKSIGVTTSTTGSEWMLWQDFGGMDSRSMGLSRCFLVLQAICRYLPDLLEIVLCGASIIFLHSCEQNSFHEKSLKQVQRLKKWSAYFLGICLGANVCVNLLQLLLARFIYSSQYTLTFPIKQIVVMLGVLMLSRFWLEGKKLKDDNTLFI